MSPLAAETVERTLAASDVAAPFARTVLEILAAEVEEVRATSSKLLYSGAERERRTDSGGSGALVIDKFKKRATFPGSGGGGGAKAAPPGSADADEGKGGLQPTRLDLVPTVLVRRNAYGRQIDSSIRPIAGRGPFEGVALEGAFIRAPKFRIVDGAGAAGGAGGGGEAAGAASVDILGVDPAEEDAVVLLRSGRALLCAFHPELTKDTRIHAFFATI